MHEAIDNRLRSAPLGRANLWRRFDAFAMQAVSSWHPMPYRRFARSTDATAQLRGSASARSSALCTLAEERLDALSEHPCAALLGRYSPGACFASAGCHGRP